MRFFQVQFTHTQAHSLRAIGLIRMHACTPAAAAEKSQLIHFYLAHSSAAAARIHMLQRWRSIQKNKSPAPPATIIYVKLNDFICSGEITFWANSSKRRIYRHHKRGKKEIDICTTSVINYQTREILIMGMGVRGRRGHWKCLPARTRGLLFFTSLKRKTNHLSLFCGTGEFA